LGGAVEGGGLGKWIEVVEIMTDGLDATLP